MEHEAENSVEPEDAADLVDRLERALERIGRGAHGAASGAGSGGVPVADIAGRLDALIAQLRMALAEHPAEEHAGTPRPGKD